MMNKWIAENSKLIGLLAGPSLFFLVKLFFHADGLEPEAQSVLACTLWIACWWITEAVPIAITSLLPIVLLPMTGAMDLSSTTESYGHKYIFLYIGGFILAIAIEKWNLHRRIALNIINIIGTNVRSIILGFMIATAFLSMWISNTATSVMMLPIGMAIVRQLKDDPRTIQDENEIFGKVLMLAIAYSASIGGVATLIGTPPNLVLAGVLSELYDVEITFSKWIIFGLPLSILLLFICWKYLTSYAFDIKKDAFPGGRTEIKMQLESLGKLTYEEKAVMAVFFLTAVSWICRSLILQKWMPNLDDTIIAVCAAVVLFIIPASKKEGRQLISWEEAVKLPWGILLLFGGGLALAQSFKSSGLAEWIGAQLSLLDGLSLVLLLLILIGLMNFLTEITSNLATTAMMLPVLAPLALSVNVHPYILMVGATVAASCAFMLPVATPPNAVVFGSGYLKIIDMARVGVFMNILSIILLTLITYYILPQIWQFDPHIFPLEFKK